LNRPAFCLPVDGSLGFALTLIGTLGFLVRSTRIMISGVESFLRRPVRVSKMPNADERQQALQQAARLKGLALVRTGDVFALTVYTAATLDEIAEFLATDSPPDTPHGRLQEQRRADLWAILRTERALIAELEEQKRNDRSGGPGHETIEAKLAEIRRRIAEIEDTNRAQALSVSAGRSRA
jgi:hypothetical protein